MITQNSKGQIILPPVYPEELIPRSETSTSPTANLASTLNGDQEGFNLSTGLIAGTLFIVLIITTLLYYRNSVKVYKSTPENKFVTDINQDKQLETNIKN